MRSVCARCRRPTSFCYCEHLPSVATQTRVVFLQHPRERRVPVSTCRMAHLALPNSELHVGVSFEEHPAVRALSGRDDVALLYAAPNEPEHAAGEPPAPPRTLVVIDGTWTQARKVLSRNPTLQRLRRIALRPSAPGNYRIRKEPAPNCLSTIEAVAEALGGLEGRRQELRGLLRAFDYMVDRQLEHVHARLPSSRRRRALSQRAPASWLPARAVLVAAEANAPSPGESETERFEPELVQLVALRLETGERFSSFARPRHPLSDATPCHLDVSPAALLDAPDRADVLARFESFLAPDESLVVWGTSTPTLLRRAGLAERVAVDARPIWRRRRKGRTGGVEDAARWVGAEVAVTHPHEGRGGRRLEALRAVIGSLGRPRTAPPASGESPP